MTMNQVFTTIEIMNVETIQVDILDTGGRNAVYEKKELFDLVGQRLKECEKSPFTSF